MSLLIQITSGQGPDECSWVVAQVAIAMEAEAKRQSHNLSVIDKTGGKRGGTVDSIVYSVAGESVSASFESWLKSWLGTIQWIGNSPYRTRHPRKNWFVAVNVLKEEKQTPWNLNDITIVSFRSSGPGGQNVNKVETAVRIVHNPTGIMVCAQESRSKSENKKLAFNRLRLRLECMKEKAQAKTRAKMRLQHFSVERGNPARIYAGARFERVR